MASSWRQTLGLTPANTAQTARSKYLDLARRLHPNKGGSTAAFQKLQNAWERAQSYYATSAASNARDRAGGSNARGSNARGSNARGSNANNNNNVIHPRIYSRRTLGDLFTVRGFQMRRSQTLRQVFDLVAANAAVIQAERGVDVSQGFKISISSLIDYPRMKAREFFEPDDRRLDSLVPPELAPYISVIIVVREKGQAKKGWYYPVSSSPPKAKVPSTVTVDVLNRDYRRTGLSVTLPKSLTVKRLYVLVAEQLGLTDDFSLRWHTRSFDGFGFADKHSRMPSKRITAPHDIAITRSKELHAKTTGAAYYRPSTGRFMRFDKRRKPHFVDLGQYVRKWRRGTGMKASRRGNISGVSVPTRNTNQHVRTAVSRARRPGREGLRRRP